MDMQLQTGESQALRPTLNSHIFSNQWYKTSDHAVIFKTGYGNDLLNYNKRPFSHVSMFSQTYKKFTQVGNAVYEHTHCIDVRQS